MDAFDADVLILAAVAGHPLGRRVAALFPVEAPADSDAPVGMGSLLLLPEVLGKPRRDGRTEEMMMLTELLSRLDLRPLDLAAAELATALSAAYRLRAADAVHLAAAVAAGADRFITTNRRDFPASIAEVEVTYPDDLPDTGN